MPPSAPPPGPDDAYFEYDRPEVVALVPTSAARILDIGCAAGALGAALKAQASREVWGVELDPGVAERARARLDHVLVGDAIEVGATLGAESFDAVIMADALEHIADTGAALAMVRRVMKPDAKLILSLPNVRHWSVLQMLLAGDWRYADAGIMDRTHLRFFTLRIAARTLKEAGFTVEQAAGTNVTAPPPEGFIEGLQSAIAAVSMESPGLAQEAALFQFLFVCAKTEP